MKDTTKSSFQRILDEDGNVWRYAKEPIIDSSGYGNCSECNRCDCDDTTVQCDVQFDPSGHHCPGLREAYILWMYGKPLITLCPRCFNLNVRNGMKHY